MHMLLLALGLIACPVAFVAVIRRMRAKGVAHPPIGPMFFLFGTLGGWFLAFAFSPSGLAALCMTFLMTAAPLALLASSIRLLKETNRSPFHRAAMWLGFCYPLIIGLFGAVAVIAS